MTFSLKWLRERNDNFNTFDRINHPAHMHTPVLKLSSLRPIYSGCPPPPPVSIGSGGSKM